MIEKRYFIAMCVFCFIGGIAIGFAFSPCDVLAQVGSLETSSQTILNIDTDTDVLKYKDTVTQKTFIEFHQEKNIELLFKDLSMYKNICFELPGDSKRCVNAKWLYLLMVASDIKEEK